MKFLQFLSRIFVGAVFIFSGFVKVVDPLGSAYKFADYFTAFKLGFLEFAALPIALLLPAFELVLGMALILGYRRRLTYLLLLIFMGFFTVLTFLLALFNPVSDCGCFGDALILTNWETFFKNVILLAPTLLLYMRGRNHVPGGAAREWAIILALYAGAVIFSGWNFRHIPLLDFRPYSVGTHIPEAMEVPEDAAVDEYETTLVYRSRETGKEEEFGMDDYPRDTLAWEFVTSESRLLKKGYEPPIHDFALMDGDGDDLTDQLLSDPGYTLLLIAHDLTEADQEALARAAEWAALERLSDNFHFYAVTASPTRDVEDISTGLGLDYAFLAADETMLKTVVRSNPGFVLLSRGTILGKWGHRGFPSPGDVDPGLNEQLANAAEPMDEEALLLREAGVWEEFSFGVLDFRELLPGLLYRDMQQAREKGVGLSFILSVLLLLVIAHGLKSIEL